MGVNPLNLSKDRNIVNRYKLNLSDYNVHNTNKTFKNNNNCIHLYELITGYYQVTLTERTNAEKIKYIVLFRV